MPGSTQKAHDTHDILRSLCVNDEDKTLVPLASQWTTTSSGRMSVCWCIKCCSMSPFHTLSMRSWCNLPASSFTSSSLSAANRPCTPNSNTHSLTYPLATASTNGQFSFSTLILLVGLLTCKNRLPYNLRCVGGDVKHCTIQSNPPMVSLSDGYYQMTMSPLDNEIQLKNNLFRLIVQSGCNMRLSLCYLHDRLHIQINSRKPWKW